MEQFHCKINGSEINIRDKRVSLTNHIDCMQVCASTHDSDYEYQNEVEYVQDIQMIAFKR